MEDRFHGVIPAGKGSKPNCGNQHRAVQQIYGLTAHGLKLSGGLSAALRIIAAKYMMPCLGASLAFVFLVLLPVISYAGDGPTAWFLDFDEARKEAVNSDRPILMLFSGSDWCIPCMRLERDLFTSEEFQRFATDSLVLLKLDFPAKKKNQLGEASQEKNEALAEMYNSSGTFPHVVLTDARGNTLGVMDHPLTSVHGYLSSIRSLINK